MDDLRRYCDLRPDGILPVYCSPEGEERIRAVFPYAVHPPGSTALRDGYARFDLRPMPSRLELPEGVIESTPLPHGRVQTLGLVFTERGSGARFAYYTDCKRVPPAARELARDADLLVLDGLRPTPHLTHLSIGEACAEASAIGARSTYLTHVAHAVHHAYGDSLAPVVQGFAYDGMQVKLGEV
jgi:phosphoribosyl 1,2-cyclic phosphate phosphodiesterase